ncbi:sugar transferase [Halomarina litorea]|uniref:sugar transferase n=1 Tax=Halomarina litorea TaxID=2961595 RepID=UPI0020C4D039|nr:sugar transferase [Halomarina sp. BCD28]
MQRTWRYRVASVGAVAALTALAVVLGNTPAAQRLVTAAPLLSRLPATTLGGRDLALAILTSVGVVCLAFVPLFRPETRRILDVVALSHRRLLVGGAGLAAVGYFDYTYRLPRTTLILVVALLFVWLPAWFVLARPRPGGDGDRAIVVGDDPEAMADIVRATDLDVVGYVTPPTRLFDGRRVRPLSPDGGTAVLEGVPCLGGLSQLWSLFVDYDADVAILAFSHPDREEFFGALDACDRAGVQAKVHRDHADGVLTTGVAGGDLVDVDVEPWDWQDRLAKRAFDVAFALVGLVVLLPVILVVTLAVKLEDGGSVLYAQERTAEFGETFTVYKFRSMLPGSEDERPGDDSARITRVGRVLRNTHLDEAPQLWSILVGDMSVVGPRAVWTDEEVLLEGETGEWRKRWFVKPGLTGLAQVNGASSTSPEEKLRYDVAYIRGQSFWYDMKIVVRQLCAVVGRWYDG